MIKRYADFNVFGLQIDFVNMYAVMVCVQFSIYHLKLRLQCSIAHSIGAPPI